MLINFINNSDPVEKDSSSKWRNALALFTVTVGVGLVVGPHIGLQDSIAVASNKVIPFLLPGSSTQAVGGDIQVEPPKPVPPPVPIPNLTGTLPEANSFTAKSIFVKDKASNKVLFAKDEYAVRPLASITKLMSALVLLEKPINWSATTTVVTGELVDNHMYAGDVYTLEQLWNAGLIASSNKAIASLVQGAGWTQEQFVARMNEKAKELGMTHTEFVEPTGLNEKNISTAADVAILLEAALQKEEIKNSLVKTEYTLYSKERNKQHRMWNTNWLLLNWIPNDSLELVGGKTGYIVASGYNFAVQVKDEKGKLINVIVLGSEKHEDRFTEARDVADAMYKAYTWPEPEIQQ